MTRVLGLREIRQQEGAQLTQPMKWIRIGTGVKRSVAVLGDAAPGVAKEVRFSKK